MYECLNFINNIYLFKFSNIINPEEIESFKNDFKNLLIEDKKIFIIFDLYNITSFKPSFFYSIYKLIDSNEELLKEKILASSIILCPKFKKTLTALINICKDISPNFISPNLSSSINFFHNLNKTES